MSESEEPEIVLSNIQSLDDWQYESGERSLEYLNEGLNQSTALGKQLMESNIEVTQQFDAESKALAELGQQVIALGEAQQEATKRLFMESINDPTSDHTPRVDEYQKAAALMSYVRGVREFGYAVRLPQMLEQKTRSNFEMASAHADIQMWKALIAGRQRHDASRELASVDGLVPWIPAGRGHDLFLEALKARDIAARAHQAWTDLVRKQQAQEALR